MKRFVFRLVPRVAGILVTNPEISVDMDHFVLILTTGFVCLGFLTIATILVYDDLLFRVKV